MRLDQSLDTCNWRPVAMVSGPADASLGMTVELSASMSSDRNGDPLTYAWSIEAQPDGSAAELSSASGEVVELTPDQLGLFEIRLVVSDGDLSRDVLWTLPVINHAPVADAGMDLSVPPGTRVTLDGTGSEDQDGDPITYRWTLVSRPNRSMAALDDPTSARPSFDADVEGGFLVELVVSDGELDSMPASITVGASIPGVTPIADAGEDATIEIGNPIGLDGSGSFDPDGDPLTYEWTLDASPMGSTATIADPLRSFTRLDPDVPGLYVFSLRVRDAFRVSVPDSVQYYVSYNLADASAFDPNEVAFFGRARGEEHNAVARWQAPLQAIVGFPGVSDFSFNVPYIIRPLDGHIVYQQRAGDPIYVFNADAYQRADDGLLYPPSPTANDVEIAPQGCPDPNRFFVDPDTSEVIQDCRGRYYDEVGVEPFTEDLDILQLGPQGSRLVRMVDTPAVRLSSGTLHVATGLIRLLGAHRTAPDGDGFWVAGRPDGATVQGAFLEQLHLDGRRTRIGTYADVPEPLRTLDRCRLAANGDLYHTVLPAAGETELSVQVRRLDGPVEIVFDSAAANGAFQIASEAVLFSGP